MPQMINGIGTTYYGKKNVAVETHKCGKCGSIGAMESYDTMLWFVIVFIPIIPLGRKRIINYCPRCTSHRVLPLAEYQRIETESIAELRQKAADNLRDASAALEYSAALMDFHKNQEALEHNAEMLRRFPDRVEVQFQAGAVYERLGQPEDADRCFERAYQLDPAFRPARRAKAVDLINASRPDEAKRLLDYMIADPAERDYGLLFLLALAYAKANQPYPALEIFRLIVADRPAFAQDKKFRQAVAAAEKAANVTESLLPRKKWFASSGGGGSGSPSVRLRPIIAIVAVIGILIAIAVPFAKSFHPTVHVISACPGPLTVAIDGGSPLNFPKPGRQELKLASGQHHARVTGPFTEDIPFDLTTSFLDRFAAPPVYVLNPGGLAALVIERTIYVPKGGSTDLGPPAETFSVAKSFFIIPGVDYPFAEFPREIKTSSDAGRTTKSRLIDLPAPPEDLARGLIAMGNESVCADYLAPWVKLQPSPERVEIFVHCAVASKKTDAAKSIVRARLDAGETEVAWHRAYQRLYEMTAADIKPLIAEYDRFLAANPDSAAFLYLRGRLDPDSAAAIGYYTRAIAQDPKNHYPLAARAYHYFCSGDYASAAKDITAARALAPDDPQVRTSSHQILFAAGDFKALQPEIEAAGDSFKDIDGSLLLGRLMFALNNNDHEAASRLVEDLRAWETKSEIPASFLFHPRLQALAAYAGKDYPALAKMAQAPGRDPKLKNMYLAWIALDQNDPASAGKCVTKDLDPDNLGPIALVASIELGDLGDAPAAAQWEQKGLAALLADQTLHEAAGCRDLVAGKTPITPKALDNILLEPNQKRILLALLAAKFPAQRKMLLAYAKKLNYNLEFPHNFIEAMK